jgi:hypothetical protein
LVTGGRTQEFRHWQKEVSSWLRQAEDFLKLRGGKRLPVTDVAECLFDYDESYLQKVARSDLLEDFLPSSIKTRDDFLQLGSCLYTDLRVLGPKLTEVILSDTLVTRDVLTCTELEASSTFQYLLSLQR